jgi:glycosyltransferase involved in cell wall biosynthesis
MSTTNDPSRRSAYRLAVSIVPAEGGVKVALNVSVVIPTHNRSDWLQLTLRSVLWQRDVSLEAIVVDDGSTDGTADVVAGMRDPRVRLLRHDTPRGVSASRNHGVEEAAGEWVAFVDDDDLWAPEKLARQIEAARGAGRAWVYAGSVNIGDSLRVISGVPPLPPEQVARSIARCNAIPGGGSNVIVRRDELERVGPFDLRLKNTEDWEMWIRLAEHGPPAWAPHPLLAHRMHSANASLDVATVLEGVSLIERGHGTRVDRGVLNRWFGESFLRSGQRGMALKHLAMAAVDGQGLNVARDVIAIVRRRLARHLGPSILPAPSHPDWIAQAQGWLDELAVPDV